jgi:HSP20 family molecular chaperone IbpA
MAKREIEVRKTEGPLEALTQLERDISERAYALFRDRNGLFGDPVTDWLKAERELIWRPSIHVRHKDSHIEILAALPGVDAKDINVEVMPQDIVINAKVNHEHTSDEGDVQVCEFRHGKAFRSVHLDVPIDPNSVIAGYHDGMLRLTAAVVQSVPEKNADRVA